MQNPVVSDPLFVRTEDQCHYCSCSEKKKSRSSYTTTISSETSGEHLKVCSPVTGSCFPQKSDRFIHNVSGDRMLTFGRGAGTLRDAGTSLWRAHAVTAEGHQPPDDSCLAWARVTHDDSPASLAAARAPQDLFQAREDPVAANEGRFCRDAGDFEQQRL